MTDPARGGPHDIAARLDGLPASRAIWTRVVLLSLGGFFEYYDLFMTGYVAPGLVRAGILTPTTPGLFGTQGVAGFVAALFAGLFVGTALFGVFADWFGRRAIFTFSLLWYSAASAVMAFQSDAFGLDLWRFVAGVGIGVELVTIDAYLAELVPAALRARAFAVNGAIQFLAVPAVALLAWLLVPVAPYGLAGWRWVALIGSAGALVVWAIRLGLPESRAGSPSTGAPPRPIGRSPRSRALRRRSIRRARRRSKRRRRAARSARSGAAAISGGP